VNCESGLNAPDDTATGLIKSTGRKPRRDRKARIVSLDRGEASKEFHNLRKEPGPDGVSGVTPNSSPSVQSIPLRSDLCASLGSYWRQSDALESLHPNAAVNRSQTLGNRPQPFGDQSKVLGDRPKVFGDHPKVLGDRKNVLSDDKKVLGAQNNGLGWHANVLGGRPKVLGAQKKALGGRSKALGDHSKVLGD
jgi:hypothetical protein